ncbi:MAG: Hsp20/alpha crystallin family protein, partial [Pyrinomonadaceae bacterium]
LERIELERLRVRVGRLFEALQEAAEMVAPPVPGALLPPVDLCESDEAITMHVELPGVPAELIKVTLTSTQLRIGGRKKQGAPRGRIAHLCSERCYGNFSRVVPLRWPISVRDATAELRHGVLTVWLPKIKDRRGAEFTVRVKKAKDEE